MSEFCLRKFVLSINSIVIIIIIIIINHRLQLDHQAAANHSTL
jgi:hypothetical protein